MKITYPNGNVPEPVNEYMSHIAAPGFNSGTKVLVDGIQGIISKITWDKAWIDIRFDGSSKRLYWHKDKQEYFGVKDITRLEG